MWRGCEGKTSCERPCVSLCVCLSVRVRLPVCAYAHTAVPRRCRTPRRTLPGRAGPGRRRCPSVTRGGRRPRPPLHAGFTDLPAGRLRGRPGRAPPHRTGSERPPRTGLARGLSWACRPAPPAPGGRAGRCSRFSCCSLQNLSESFPAPAPTVALPPPLRSAGAAPGAFTCCPRPGAALRRGWERPAGGPALLGPGSRASASGRGRRRCRCVRWLLACRLLAAVSLCPAGGEPWWPVDGYLCLLEALGDSAPIHQGNSHQLYVPNGESEVAMR